jgi:RNA polymerase sigma factor (sigma-70 family)
MARRKLLFGTIFKIRSRTLDRATEKERKMLELLSREPFDYVDHPAFVFPDAENKFMRPIELEGVRPVQRFIQAKADPIGGLEDINIPKSTNLSAAQEKAMFMQYNYCRYRLAKMARQPKPLGLSQLRELLAWFSRVLDLRDQLVNANMPLVLAMARKNKFFNIDFADLLSEGAMALLRSVEKFNAALGFKFSTYACRGIIKGFLRVAKTQNRYRNHFPSEYDPKMDRSDFLENWRESIEADCVDELRKIIRHNSANLNDIEQVVIRERFAISDNGEELQPKTLAEVGHIIGLTKERVRQIQNRAMQRIREFMEVGLDDEPRKVVREYVPLSAEARMRGNKPKYPPDRAEKSVRKFLSKLCAVQ